MYGNQAIWALEAMLRSGYWESSPYSIHLRHVIDRIKNAQHFHLGERNNLSAFSDAMKREGTYVFEGALGEVRTPYPLTWVDCKSEGQKRGVLIEEIAHNYLILHYLIYDPKSPSGWHLVPVVSHVSLYEGAVTNNNLNKMCYDAMVRIRGKGDTPPRDLVESEEVASFICLTAPDMASDARELLGFLADHCMSIANTFLYLLKCRNVISTENQHPGKSRQGNKKRDKELFTFKTLSIKLPGTAAGKRRDKTLSEEDRRIHLCRGHFKTFTEDKPLFGSVTGTYWWQPSVRGNKKKGVVMKDYKVTPRKPTPSCSPD